MVGTLYGVLGVAQDTEKSDIVSAYREQVKRHHPDVNDAPDARERFQRIRTAKEVLADADERARYDSLGHETYVRRHLDAERWGVSETPTGSQAASSVSESETTGSPASATTASKDSGRTAASGSTASRQGYRADGGAAAGYYTPGERIGGGPGGSFLRLSDVLVDMGPILVGHLVLLLSTAAMAGWLVAGASGGVPSLPTAVVAVTMVGITGCLSILHLTTTVYR